MSKQEPKTNLPWYRQPMPTWFPGWIVFCLAMSAVIGFLGYESFKDHHDPWPGIRGAIAGALLGFPIGILFLLAIQRQTTRGRHAGPGLPPQMLPPTWLSAVTTVAAVVFFGTLYAERKDQTIGLLMVAASSLVGIALLRPEPRGFLTFPSGVVCLLLSVGGFVYAVIRVIYSDSAE